MGKAELLATLFTRALCGTKAVGAKAEADVKKRVASTLDNFMVSVVQLLQYGQNEEKRIGF